MGSAFSRRIRTKLFTHLPEISERWFARHFNRERLSAWSIYGTDSQDLTWLKKRYIEPALRLLGEYIGTGDEKYLAVYLDERLRYAPHRLSKAGRVRFFKELIFDDQADLLAPFDPDSAEYTYLKEVLTKIHAPLLDEGSKGRLEVLALGDCLLNEVRIFLAQKCRARGVDVDMRSMYFSATENAELDPSSAIEYLGANKVDAVAVSFFTFDGMRSFSRLMQEYPKLTPAEIDSRIEAIMLSVREFLLRLREHTQAPFLVHNVCGLPLSSLRKHVPLLAPIPTAKAAILERINQEVGRIVLDTPNSILIDERAIAYKCGVRALSRNILPWWLRKDAFFHTSALGEKLAQAYTDVLEVLARYGKMKALLVDFDNTLWDGVMADGEVKHFRDRQGILWALKEAGIILIAVSKNSPQNIRWDEITVKEKDFALLKINWNLKAQSIEEAAAELNLGLDSFVFVDDNPAERELVSNAHPKVRVIDATDPKTWEDLKLVLQLPNTQETEEARTRTEMYQAQVKRQTALRSEQDYPKMMASLELRMLVRRAEARDTARLFELVNRTNQFNTTTVRLSKAEVKAFISDPHRQVWVAELTDKFSSLGLIAAVIVKEEADGQGLIESFVMSCRAMGYRVEQQMLFELASRQTGGVRRIIGRYLETERNAPCRDLYKSCGFRPVSATDWAYELGTDQGLKAIPWIAIRGAEG